MVGRRRSVGSRREFDGCIFQQVRSRFPSRYLVGLRIAGTRSGVRYSGASYQDPSDGAPPRPPADGWLCSHRSRRAEAVEPELWGLAASGSDGTSSRGSGLGQDHRTRGRSRLGLARRRSVDRPACGLWPTLEDRDCSVWGRLGQGPSELVLINWPTPAKSIRPTGPRHLPRGVAGELRPEWPARRSGAVLGEPLSGHSRPPD
jgi:hypothetical protein